MNWTVPDERMTSAQRKLKRGVEHVDRLRKEVKAYEEAGAYVFSDERTFRSSNEAEYRCFATQEKGMPSHWPLLAGEAIQNLRSALDHLVYEKSGGKRSTQFPIFTEQSNFEDKAPGRLKGVPDDVKAKIEEVQPFRAMPDAAVHDPLAQLSSFSNLDKHRVLATIVSAVTREGVGIPDGVKLTWVDPATNKRLGSGRTQISTFTALSEGEIEAVTVEPMFSYEVRIEMSSVGTLAWIGNHVYRVMAEIDTGEPLSMFAPYPL